MKNKVVLVLALLLLVSLACAYDSSKNLVVKWGYRLPYTARAFALGDLDGDDVQEVIVGLQNNTILVLDLAGNLKANYSLDNISKVGKIYALSTGDIDNDGKDEIVAGLGGLRVTETFEQYAFVAPNESSGDSTGDIVWKNKVLYRTSKYTGNLYYIDNDGKVLWKKSSYNSVLDVDIEDIDGNGVPDILVGIGDYSVETFSEAGTINYTNTTCTEEYIIDEYIGYDEDKCSNCPVCDEDEEYASPCDCDWNATTDECLVSYNLRECETIVTQVDGRHLIDYEVWNGSMMVYEKSGRVIWRIDVNLNGTSDNNVRTVLSEDINDDGYRDLIFGLDEGILFGYNLSGKQLYTGYGTSIIFGGITDVKLYDDSETTDQYFTIGSNNGILAFTSTKKSEPEWIARLDRSVESIDISDIDGDDVQEILVASSDGNMYVYDPDGINEWRYTVGSPLYFVKAFDADSDGYMDVLLGSSNNITLYEMNVDYVLRQSADFYYQQADEKYEVNDYTLALIYITKAKDVYFEIQDAEGIMKSDLLIKKINQNLMAVKKFEADANYDRAVSSYARNDIDQSILFLETAKSIYEEIGDAVGVSKTEAFRVEIEHFIVSEKALTASFHYSKALTHFGFKKYDESLIEARQARSIYEEIDFFNGTVQASRLITSIADAYYTEASIQLSMRNFNESLIYANQAMLLYNETKNYDGTAKTELLIQDINRKMIEGPVVEDDFDYMLIIYALLGVFVIIVILQVVKSRMGKPKKPSQDKLGEDVKEAKPIVPDEIQPPSTIDEPILPEEISKTHHDSSAFDAIEHDDKPAF